MTPSSHHRFLVIGAGAALLLAGVAMAWDPLPVADDPLLRMPGTQPDQGVVIEEPVQCFNCHGGYNAPVEPGFNWRGSMMAQAARDFLFWSAVTVAAQDSVWALGNPNATDLCLRCHLPEGWLGGRSDPTNGSDMTATDFDGVHCGFCHRLMDPFFETTYAGTREGDDWPGDWDETDASGTPSSDGADETYGVDAAAAPGFDLFNGDPFYSGLLPPTTYHENGSGQYFASPDATRRASFADAKASHQAYYSRYHKSKFFCSSCHDVSNPALENLGADPADPLPTEEVSAYSYFHVERTFSEFMLSAYGQQGGAAGIGPFAPAIWDTSLPNDWIGKCQDCHMQDITGYACKQTNKAILRPGGSVEHPKSGLPKHDLTGGNAWVSWVLASAISGAANYDATNATLLGQGPSVLTLDLTQGLGIDPVALLDGVQRAKQTLGRAAAITGLTYEPGTGAVSFRVQNHTGHKLISGFPEGRRMFVNVKVFAGGEEVYEVNPYDDEASTLKGLGALYGYTYDDPDGVLPDPEPLETGEEVLDDSLVYEAHPNSSLTGETEATFHFVLATGRGKDNRIPPKGFDKSGATDRLVQPVEGGSPDLNYFTDAEYLGGYDQVQLTVPTGADRVEVRLYYQTTSREYVEFLRNEINGEGALTLTDPGAGGDPAYIVQTDSFFSALAAWGDTLWQLWRHNRTVPGAAPILIAEAEHGMERLTVTKNGTGTGTVTSSPPGIDCGSTCSALFSKDTVVTLNAAADSGSTFDGWSGDPDCTDGVVSMSTDVACTATFSAPCPYDDVVDLHDLTVTDTQIFSACVEIHAGPNFVVTSTGDATLRAGVRVILDDGVSVQTGGALTIVADPSVLTP
jgi:hypothetical protein